MEKNVIKYLIIEYQQFTEKITLTERDIHLSDQLNYVFVGLRRAGKSYLMYQQIQHLLKEEWPIKSISDRSRDIPVGKSGSYLLKEKI